MSRFCKRGHDTDKVGRKPNRTCKECSKSHSQQWREQNPDKVVAMHQKRRQREMQHSVYLLYAPDGTLLYAGRSSRPPNRFNRHREYSPWWSEVDESKTITEPTGSPAASLLYEAVLIHSFDPPRNRFGTERRGTGTPYVYEYVNAEGELIYVGSGSKHRAYATKHGSKAQWSHEVASITLTQCLSWADARLIEASRIYLHQPKYNKEGVTR